MFKNRDIDPETGEKVELATFTEIFKFAFMAIMVLKTLAFDFGIYGYIKRTHETHKSCN